MNIQLDDATAKAIADKLKSLFAVLPVDNTPQIQQQLASTMNSTISELQYKTVNHPSLQRLERLLSDFNESQNEANVQRVGNRNDNCLLIFHACVVLSNSAEYGNNLATAFLGDSPIKFEQKYTPYLRETACLGQKNDSEEAWQAAKQRTLKKLHALQSAFAEQAAADQQQQEETTALDNNDDLQQVNQPVIPDDATLTLAKCKRRQQLLFSLNLLLLAAIIYMFIDGTIYAHGAGFAPFGLLLANLPALSITISVLFIVCSVALFAAAVANSRPESLHSKSADLAHGAYQPPSSYEPQAEQVEKGASKSWFTQLFSCCHNPSATSASPESRTPLFDGTSEHS